MTTYAAHEESEFAPPAEVGEPELYHPKTFIGKYIWSQDAKVIALQYAATAIAIGLVALVFSWLMRLQLGFPGSVSFIDPSTYLQLVSMHGMIMVIYLLTALFLGGFGNYLIPLMVGARDMVFPYVNMVSYWLYLVAVLLLVASFFVPGGRHRRRLDAVPAAGDHCPARRGHDWRHHPAAGVAAASSSSPPRWAASTTSTTVLQARTRGHDAAAHAADGVGHLRRHHPGAARLSRRCSSPA
jgi:hypothetical protein